MHVKDLLWSWRELEAIGDPVVVSLLIHQRIYIFYMYKFWREQLPNESQGLLLCMKVVGVAKCAMR